MSNLERYPSVGSVHSMTSLGYIPHSRAYLPLKTSPGKPYGPSFISVMNRMWRGSGRKYVIYAVISLCAAVLFFVGGALYFGHRNVSRMIVLNTEVLGALMIAGGILFSGAFYHFMYEANMASNRWRGNIRFRAEGLCSVAPYNQAYTPDDEGKLATGTYGPLAIKELTRGRPNRSRSRGILRSGAITPRTPLIYAEQDMSQTAHGREDESMRSSIQWPPRPPASQEVESWQLYSKVAPIQGTSKEVGFDRKTADGREAMSYPVQRQQFMQTPTPPPPPPPPPTALPPVSRQPVSTAKKNTTSGHDASLASQSQQQQQQQQLKQSGQQKARPPLVRLSYEGSESEL